MTIGELFAKAFELWRRDVGWLILAGLLVGIIMAVIFGVALLLATAIFAGAGVGIGGSQLSSDSNGGLAAIGVGMLILGFILYVVVLFLIDVVSLTFYGGMFAMVIGAARDDRGVVFSDLFSGFRGFRSYAVFALVLFGVSFGLNLLGVIPLIGPLIGFVVYVWLSILWLYVLPLIADQGVGFGDAARTSGEMVKGVGWWRTFGLLILLGLAMSAILVVILLLAYGVGRDSAAAGLLIGGFLLLLFGMLATPYAICYVSVLYLGSGGSVMAKAAPAMGIPMPPAPGGPYAPGAGTYVTPSAGQYGGSAAPYAAPSSDTWKAAADPLAGLPPSPPPVQSQTPPPAAQAGAPAVDAASGRLEKHCSQCGAGIAGSDELCQACALEVSGGEGAGAAPGSPESAPPAPEAPAAPQPPGM